MAKDITITVNIVPHPNPDEAIDLVAKLVLNNLLFPLAAK